MQFKSLISVRLKQFVSIKGLEKVRVTDLMRLYLGFIQHWILKEVLVIYLTFKY